MTCRAASTTLKGLRNDIEVFRCRGLIDETPVYQEHLAKVNEIRHEFPELLLEGRYTATDGFSCNNPAVVVRSYTSGNRMAIVVTYTGSGRQNCRLNVPGYRLVTYRTIGEAGVNKTYLNLGQNDLAVLIFESQNEG